MNTKKCKFCSEEIAKNAKRCPKCGRRIKTPVFEIIIIVIIGLAVLGSLGDNSSTVKNEQKESNVVDAESNEPKKSPEEIRTEFVNECESFNYKDIARQPESFKGKKGKFRGKVIQVREGTFDSNSITLRVNVTEGNYGLWEDTVYVTYKYKDGENKILEDDIINMYGIIEGTESYVSVLGSKITIPSMNAKYIDLEQ